MFYVDRKESEQEGNKKKWEMNSNHSTIFEISWSSSVHRTSSGLSSSLHKCWAMYIVDYTVWSSHYIKHKEKIFEHRWTKMNIHRMFVRMLWRWNSNGWHRQQSLFIVKWPAFHHTHTNYSIVNNTHKDASSLYLPKSEVRIKLFFWVKVATLLLKWDETGFSSRKKKCCSPQSRFGAFSVILSSF